MLRKYYYVDLCDGECLSLTAKTKSQADMYAISALSEPIFIKSEGVTNNGKGTDIEGRHNKCNY